MLQPPLRYLHPQAVQPHSGVVTERQITGLLLLGQCVSAAGVPCGVQFVGSGLRFVTSRERLLPIAGLLPAVRARRVYRDGQPVGVALSFLTDSNQSLGRRGARSSASLQRDTA